MRNLRTLMRPALAGIDRLRQKVGPLPRCRWFHFDGRADRFAEFLPDTEIGWFIFIMKLLLLNFTKSVKTILMIYYWSEMHLGNG